MPTAISLKGVGKSFASVQALLGVDLDIDRGDFFALLGPNGAGKSTLIGILTTLIHQFDGDVSVMGHSLRAQSGLVKQFIGVVPQEFNFNVFEKPEMVLVHQAGYYGISRHLAHPRAVQLLKRLDLWDKRETIARNLSGGMKRRLMIARALMHAPSILILDEPTAGVDIENRHSMWSFLKELNAVGTTIVLTTHYLEEAEQLCRHIAILDHGQVIEHTNMPALLSTLQHEQLQLQCTSAIDVCPRVDGVLIEQLDANTLQVCLPRQLPVTDLIVALSQQGVSVDRFSHTRNRLEQLFLQLTGKHRQFGE